MGENSVTCFDFSYLPGDAALLDYLPGIVPAEECPATFLSHYDFLPDKSVKISNYTRKEFWDMVMRSITLLQSLGATKGNRIIHYVSGNIVEDLVLRTASIFLATVPVTINWQADTVSQIDYKITSTEATIIVVDSNTPNVLDLKGKYTNIRFLSVNDVHTTQPIENASLHAFLKSSDVARAGDTRCIIFTSGTTGHPKGVELSYVNYRVNRATFESFLGLEDKMTQFVPVAVNPMHHTNSTSITDWALRRPRTHLHLLDRYSTQYWSVLAGVTMNISMQNAGQIIDAQQAVSLLDIASSSSSSSQRVVVSPLVSRHIDFLESLADSESLGVPSSVMRECLSRAVLLIGSAPVGPSTTRRLMKYANRLPTVRFGATETTLQVSGIPVSLSYADTMAAFESGWGHVWGGEPCQGFYIGREHRGFTQVRIVQSVHPLEELVDCSEGQPGYIITKGGHVMRGYVNQPALTKDAVTEDGWYLKLGDIGFFLGPERNLYWQSRDSQMLIRGGSNYAFEQVNAELAQFIETEYSLPRSAFNVAVCGLRVKSEHEDECCVMIELLTEQSKAAQPVIESTFLAAAKLAVSKGSKPDRVAVGPIPVLLSKGIVSVPELISYWNAQ